MSNGSLCWLCGSAGGWVVAGVLHSRSSPPLRFIRDFSVGPLIQARVSIDSGSADALYLHLTNHRPRSLLVFPSLISSLCHSLSLSSVCPPHPPTLFVTFFSSLCLIRLRCYDRRCRCQGEPVHGWIWGLVNNSLYYLYIVTHNPIYIIMQRFLHYTRFHIFDGWKEICIGYVA